MKAKGAYIAAIIKSTCDLDSLAYTLKCSKATIYNRLREPMNITLGELMAIRKESGMSKEDFTALLMRCL